VHRPDGRRLPARVEVFDPDRDLAVLAEARDGQQPLPIGSAVVGSSGAVFGHPRGQTAVEVSPAVVTRRVDAMVNDIYDERRVPRQVLVLASRLDPGDSGGPLVDGSGTVVGVAFAVSGWFRDTAFAVASEELVPVLARPRTGAVSTGACLP
jgi:S1-C subfamily serine protease